MKNKPEITNTYRELALRTLSSQTFLGKDDEKYCSFDQLHAIDGIVTEIDEIDTDVSKDEEVGDTGWFLNLGFNSIDVNFGDVVFEATQEVRARQLSTNGLERDRQKKIMQRAAIHLIDCRKASIFYGRELHKNFNPKGEKLSWRETVKNDLTIITKALAHLCIIEKIDIYKAMEDNLNKLMIRYPEKFSTESANNRDVNKELEVFTGLPKLIKVAPIAKEDFEKANAQSVSEVLSVSENSALKDDLKELLKEEGVLESVTAAVESREESIEITDITIEAIGPITEIQEVSLKDPVSPASENTDSSENPAAEPAEEAPAPEKKRGKGKK